MASWDPLTGGSPGGEPAPNPNPRVAPAPGMPLQDSTGEGSKGGGSRALGGGKMGLGGGPLARTGGGLFDDGPVVQTTAPLASRPAPSTAAAPHRPAQPPPQQRLAAQPAGASNDPMHAPSGVRPPMPPPGNPQIGHSKPGSMLASPAMHPLAAPTAAVQAIGTPVHGHGPTGQSASPMTPAGARPPPPSPMTPQPPPVPLPDPEQMMAEFLGRQVARRVTMQPDKVSQDIDGLRKLAEARSWRALMQLSQQLLADKPAPPPPVAVPGAVPPGESGDEAGVVERGKISTARLSYLEIAAFRVAALLQMRNYRAAHEELSRLASLDDVPLWTGQDGRPTVGVALRVLEAEVRNAMGQRRQAIDNLYLLLTSVKSMLSKSEDGGEDEGGGAAAAAGAGRSDESGAGKEAGLSLLQAQGPKRAILQQQRRTITVALVSQHIESGDYASARALLEERPCHVESDDKDAETQGWDAAFGWALVRLHVHFGSLPAAEQALADCEQRDPETANGVRAHRLVCLCSRFTASHDQDPAACCVRCAVCGVRCAVCCKQRSDTASPHRMGMRLVS